MSKPEFTERELSYLADTDFLLAKKKVIDKVIQHFRFCSTSIDKEIRKDNFIFNPEYLKPYPKISRGENYRGLPYVVLDNPRYYTHEVIFSYRILFWWGHFISFSLHMEGPEAFQTLENLIENRDNYSGESIFFCVGRTPWEYHFEEDNYVELKFLSDNEILSQWEKNGFLKISKKATLDEWPLLNDLAIRNFHIFSDLISPDQQS